MFTSFIGNAFTKEVKLLLFFWPDVSHQVGHDVLCKCFPDAYSVEKNPISIYSWESMSQLDLGLPS